MFFFRLNVNTIQPICSAAGFGELNNEMITKSEIERRLKSLIYLLNIDIFHFIWLNIDVSFMVRLLKSKVVWWQILSSTTETANLQVGSLKTATGSSWQWLIPYYFLMTVKNVLLKSRQARVTFLPSCRLSTRCSTYLWVNLGLGFLSKIDVIGQKVFSFGIF